MDGEGRVIQPSLPISGHRLLRSATSLCRSPSRTGNVVSTKTPHTEATDFTINPDTCAICFEENNEQSSVKLPMCGHKFHGKCLMPWFLGGDLTCPQCRAEPPPPRCEDNYESDTSNNESDDDEDTSYPDEACWEYAQVLKNFDSPLARQFATIRKHEHDLVSIRHDHTTLKRELRTHENECIRRIDEFANSVWDDFETQQKESIRKMKKVCKLQRKITEYKRRTKMRIIHKTRNMLLKQDALILSSRSNEQ